MLYYTPALVHIKIILEILRKMLQGKPLISSLAFSGMNIFKKKKQLDTECQILANTCLYTLIVDYFRAGYLMLYHG